MDNYIHVECSPLLIEQLVIDAEKEGCDIGEVFLVHFLDVSLVAAVLLDIPRMRSMVEHERQQLAQRAPHLRRRLLAAPIERTRTQA